MSRTATTHVTRRKVVAALPAAAAAVALPASVACAAGAIPTEAAVATPVESVSPELPELIERHRRAEQVHHDACLRRNDASSVVARQNPELAARMYPSLYGHLAALQRSHLTREDRQCWEMLQKQHGVVALQTVCDKRRRVEKDACFAFLEFQCRTLEDAAVKARYLLEPMNMIPFGVRSNETVRVFLASLAAPQEAVE